MNDPRVDTRSTAFVFGELASDEAAAFERELEKSPELQEEVAAIRDCVSALESEFDTLAVPIDVAHQRRIERAIQQSRHESPAIRNDASASVPGVVTADSIDRRRIWISVAAIAASLLIVVGLWYPTANRDRVEAVSMNDPAVPSEVPEQDDSMLVGDDMEQMLDQDQERLESIQFDPEPGDWVAGPTDEPAGVAQPEMIDDEDDFARPQASGGDAQSAESEALGGLADATVQPPAGDKVQRDFGAVADSATEAMPDPGRPDAFGSPPVDEVLGQGNGQVQPFTDIAAAATEMESELSMGMGGELNAFGDVPLGDHPSPDQFGLLPADERAQGDRFDRLVDNPFVDVRDTPLSTFAVDVDTASYAKVRSLLNQSILPQPAAVRIEEWLNYFDYDYAGPTDEHPFAASMEIATCPWNQTHRLARIGIRGRSVQAERPASNLVFLLDVSGSMNEPNKLPLVIEGMKMLTDQLNENDSVAIVVYAGAAGLILDSTRGDQKDRIVEALDRLRAGGSTNGGQGILLAYEIARDNFIVGGTNRVILCTDGDFNVGLTSDQRLEQLAEREARNSKIFLSVLGFGMGNHNDAMMERISNVGDGNYSFIDSRQEARKVLVEELGGTLVTIAKDVKVQVDFNPQQVKSYRLIGYENRLLAAEDFTDDTKDAGEIGAGHTVTALYEIVPTSEVDPTDQTTSSDPTLMLKLRYKQPDGDSSTLIEFPVADAGKHFSQTDRDFRFAAAVAAFGMIMRDSPYKGSLALSGVERWARDGARGDDFGYRTEFVDLVVKARELRGE